MTPDPEFCPATGKVRHPSRKVAQENLARTRRNFDARGKDRRVCGKLMAYQCPLCGGGWHLGNNDPEAAKRRRRRDRRPRPDDAEEAA